MVGLDAILRAMNIAFHLRVSQVVHLLQRPQREVFLEGVDLRRAVSVLVLVLVGRVHRERHQRVSQVPDQRDVPDGLRVSSLSSALVADLPVIVEDQVAVGLRVVVPGSEYDDPLLVIYERPAPSPVRACRPVRFYKLFSVHIGSKGSIVAAAPDLSHAPTVN